MEACLPVMVGSEGDASTRIDGQTTIITVSLQRTLPYYLLNCLYRDLRLTLLMFFCRGGWIFV
jgi:hypothetical protein